MGPVGFHILHQGHGLRPRLGAGERQRESAVCAALCRSPVKPSGHRGDDLRYRELGPVGGVQDHLAVQDMLPSTLQRSVLRRLRQLLRRAHKGADVVQKGEEVAQVLSRAVVQPLRRAGQLPPLPGREPRQHLPRHGGLQMDMELHLGHARQKGSQMFHCVCSSGCFFYNECRAPEGTSGSAVFHYTIPAPMCQSPENTLPFCQSRAIILLGSCKYFRRRALHG